MNITINVPDGYKLTSVVDDKAREADPAKMTNDALLYQLEYGHQRCVNDRTGGKDKTPADKAAIAEAMIERLESPEFTRRVSGPGEAPIMSHLRAVLRGMLKAKPFAEKRAEYKKVDEDRRDEWLHEWYAAFDEQTQANVEKAAKKRMADAAKQRESLAELAAESAKLAI